MKAAPTLSNDAAILGDFSVPAKIAASVKTPTLVLGGEKSPLPLRNAVKKLAETIPLSELRFLQGQKHDVSAKAIVPVLVEYFK